MTSSSGIKRGVAAAAISALAVAGLPLLAGTASATPIASTLGANAVELYSTDTGTVSTKNDGTNTTVSLVAGGGSAVNSVLFQYRATSTGASWIDIGAVTGRNADGVFQTEWSTPPADLLEVRAVPNTGEANADTNTPVVNAGTGAGTDTVELDSEGALGVFQEPYSNGGTYDATTSELLGVTGTVSQGSAGPTITNASHGTGPGGTGTIETTPDTASDTFNAVVDIDGYPYSAGSEPNQIALNAATDTDDAEGSTLYVQTIGSITATPATQEDVTPNDSTVTLTVLDTTGQPVAGAEVFSGGDTDTDGAGADTDADGAETRVGYTNGRGQIVATPGGAGAETYYVNVTDTDTREAGDPFTTATVTTYTPVLTTVDIVNERNRSNFDRDEFSDSDDFSIVTKDQRGNGFNEDLAGPDVEYRYIFNPDAAGPDQTTAWMPGETDGTGKFMVPGPTGFGEGTYTLEARRPNVGGTGLINAAPETFEGSDAAVTFDEGNAANAPVNGDITLTGTLANDDGGLGGREVELDYVPDGAGNADFAPQSAQPAGTDVIPDAGGPGSTVFAVTAASGDFSVVLRDPAIPANVTPTEESGELQVDDVDETATDTTSLGVTAAIDVFFIETPPVSRIEVSTDAVLGQFGPGRPVNVDVEVYGEDDDTNPNNDPVLSDYPVSVEVSKGFLTSYAAGGNPDNFDLDEDQDDEGDLWGFFENEGTSVDTSTGDDSVAQIAAAIERDADFDDNGLTDMTITVTAGDVSESETLTADSRNPINVASADLVRDAGEPAGEVEFGTDEVDFNFNVTDQFGNLAGDEDAQVTDDSTVADFTTEDDGDRVRSDYTTSGASVTAFSMGETVQTLMATWAASEFLVEDDEDLDAGSRTATADSDPIVWVGDAGPEPRQPITAELKGRNTGADVDKLKVVTDPRGVADGAVVNLYRFNKNGVRVLIESSELNANGIKRFQVLDRNGRKFTKYVARVKRTDDSKGVKRTNFKRVR